MSTRRDWTDASMPAKSVFCGLIVRPRRLATAWRTSLSSPVSLSPTSVVYGAYGWTATVSTPGSMVSSFAAVPETGCADSADEHAEAVTTTASRAATTLLIIGSRLPCRWNQPTLNQSVTVDTGRPD